MYVNLELVTLGHAGDRVSGHISEAEAELDVVIEPVAFEGMDGNTSRRRFALAVNCRIGKRFGTPESASRRVSDTQSTGSDRERSTFIGVGKAGNDQRSTGPLDVIEKDIEREGDRIGRKIKGIIDSDRVGKLQGNADGDRCGFPFARGKDDRVGEGVLSEEPTRRGVPERVVRTDRDRTTLGRWAGQNRRQRIVRWKEVVGKNVKDVGSAVSSDREAVVLQDGPRAVVDRVNVIFDFPSSGSARGSNIAGLRETEASKAVAHRVGRDRESHQVVTGNSGEVRDDLLARITPDAVAIEIDPALNKRTRAGGVGNVDADDILSVAADQRGQKGHTVFVIDDRSGCVQRTVGIVAISARGGASIDFRVPIRTESEPVELTSRCSIVGAQSRVGRRCIAPVGGLPIAEIKTAQGHRTVVGHGVETAQRERLHVAWIDHFADRVGSSDRWVKDIRSIGFGDRGRFTHIGPTVTVEVKVNVNTCEPRFARIANSIAVDVEPFKAGRTTRRSEGSKVGRARAAERH